MFTGLIDTVGTCKSLAVNGKAAELTVLADYPSEDIVIGESIAVNGTCLTVTRACRGAITFYTLAETLKRTNLGKLKAGAQVNLERALKLGDRLGGHVVSGHVDGTAAILAIGKHGDDLELIVELCPELAPYIVMKGSIAINGTSLTVARLEDQSLGVFIIPHTWTHTNLCTLKVGDIVNLETDLFGKYILRQRELAAPSSSSITMDTLAQAGFF